MVYYAHPVSRKARGGAVILNEENKVVNAKQQLAILALCAVVVETAWAHFPVDVSPQQDDGLLGVGWTPVQLGVYSGWPFQLVQGSADVYGVAAGVLNLRQQSAVASVAIENGIRNNYFAQVGMIDVCRVNWAFEFGLLCLAGRNVGISAGVFNVESNWGYRGGDPYPWLPGLQIGVLNAGGGVQIGLLNYNPQGFLPWFPLFNFPCGNRSGD